jgi:hypothetical protein
MIIIIMHNIVLQKNLLEDVWDARRSTNWGLYVGAWGEEEFTTLYASKLCSSGP